MIEWVRYLDKMVGDILSCLGVCSGSESFLNCRSWLISRINEHKVILVPQTKSNSLLHNILNKILVISKGKKNIAFYCFYLKIF